MDGPTDQLNYDLAAHWYKDFSSVLHSIQVFPIPSLNDEHIKEELRYKKRRYINQYNSILDYTKFQSY